MTARRQPEFSMPWKTFRIFFHTLENFSDFFPYPGKLVRIFSIPWKTFARFFHAMENLCGFFPYPGKLVESRTPARGAA
jgi:hypothetical protein